MAKIIGFIEPVKGRVLLKKLVDDETWAMNYDEADADGIYTCYEFVEHASGVTQNEFEEIIENIYGPSLLDDGCNFKTQSRYFHKLPAGLCIIELNEFDFYGGVVDAIFVPDCYDLDWIREDMEIWCKTIRS